MAGEAVVLRATAATGQTGQGKVKLVHFLVKAFLVLGTHIQQDLNGVVLDTQISIIDDIFIQALCQDV